MDFQLGRGVSSIASYVAATRPRKKEDLLIYCKFDREVFMQGEPEGVSLLLRNLRGEKIDWKAIEDKHMPQRLCKEPCMSVKPKAEFSQKEWANTNDAHFKACMLRMRDQGKAVRCSDRRAWLGKEELSRTKRQQIRCQVPRLLGKRCAGVRAVRNKEATPGVCIESVGQGVGSQSLRRMPGCQKVQRWGFSSRPEEAFGRGVDQQRRLPQMHRLCSKALLFVQQGTGTKIF